MPVIPRLNRPSAVGAAPEPRAATMYEPSPEGAALEQAGHEVATIGSSLAEFERRSERAEKLLQYTEAKQNVAADLDLLKASFADRTDYDKFEEDWAKGSQEIIQKHTDGIKFDDVRQRVSPYIEAMNQRGLIAVKSYGRKLRISALEASADSQYEKDLITYANMRRSDPESAELIKSSMEMREDELVATGARTFQKAQKLKDGWDKAVQVWEIGNDIRNITTPEQADMMRKLIQDPKNYPLLDPGERLKFDEAARTQGNVLWSEKQRAQHEASEQASIKMYALEDDKKTPLLTKLAWADEQVKLGLINPGEARAFKHRLENPEGSKSTKTNPNVWSDLYERMHSDDPKERPTAQELLKARNNGQLSESDYEDFIKARTSLKVQDKKQVQAEEAAFRKEQNDLIKDQWGFVKGVYAKPEDKKVVPYIQKRIEQQVMMYKPGTDINKMRRDVETYTQSLVDYIEAEGKGTAVKAFQKQFKEEFSPQIFETNKTTPPKKEAKATEPKKSTRPKQLPVGWTEKNGKVYNDKGNEMHWVED